MKSWLSSQNEPTSHYLIVGLGNPGEEYAETRHNIGFKVVEELASRYGFTFKREKSLNCRMARGNIFTEGGERGLLLVQPQTFMNKSGLCVQACKRYYKVDLSNLLVISDDVYLEFGTLRLRREGSSGGHNGLKSIEASLATQQYARLRVGVGAPSKEGVLADYVLEKFSREEQKDLPAVIKRAVDLLTKEWIPPTYTK